MLEKELEQYFRKQMLYLGALPLKFVSPGKAGVPDRIVLIPGGHVLFAELKRPGEGLRPLQQYVAREFSLLGFPVRVLDSQVSVDLLAGEIRYLSERRDLDARRPKP